MARVASKTLSGGSSPNQHRLELHLSQGSQNFANNTTQVSWSLRLVHTWGTPGSYRLYNDSSWSARVKGNNFSGSTSYDFRNNLYGTMVLGSGTITVSHNSSGYATVGASGSFSAGANHIGSASLSGSLTLSRIPKPPSAPRSLKKGSGTPSSVALSWNAPSDSGGRSISGYTIQYATNSGFSTGTGTQTSSNRSTTISGLTPGPTYYFRVRATNSRGSGSWSNVVSATPSLPAPTFSSWRQNSSGGLVARWSAPSVTSGLTGYRLQVARNSKFTSGVKNFYLGNTTSHTVTGLAGGRIYYARVAARTSGGTNAWSYGLSTMLVLSAGDLDGWTRVGTKPAALSYYTAEGIRRGTSGGRQALWLESTATGAVSVPSGTLGIEKTITGLTVGKAYRFEARATVAGSPAVNTYRLLVVGEGGAPSVTVSSNTDLGLVEFVADTNSATLRIMLSEDISVGEARDQVERVAFRNIRLLELATDYQVRLRETVYETNLANHFDLACNSAGASWYVAKDGVTRFRLPGASLPVEARFTDEADDDALHYVDVNAAYDTRSMVNRLDVTNYGVDDERENEENDTLVVQDLPSVAQYGTRSINLDTNLWDENPYDASLRAYLGSVLAGNKEPQILISGLRWNAQENIDVATSLEVGDRILVEFNGTEQDSQIVNILHDIRPERWIVTLELARISTGPAEPALRRQIEFSGINWRVRPTLDSNGPGPNAWSDSEEAAYVDAEGHLHLTIYKDERNVWRCVEVEGPQLGYGKYTWVVNTDPNPWGIEPVLGLFTYDDSDDGTTAYRELDIEFSKWNFAPEPSRNWYSVQPVQETINGVFTVNEALSSDHQLSAALPYTCTFVWEPHKVTFVTTDANNLVLGEHVVTDRVFAPYEETVRMNLWLIEGIAPADDQSIHVEINSFEFTPGVTVALPKAEDVTADFSTGLEGFAMKTSGQPGGPLSHIVDGKLTLECNGQDYSIAYSGSVFNLVGSSADVRVDTLPLGGTYTQEALYMLRYDQHNYLSMFYSTGGLYGRVRTNDENEDIFLANEDLENGQRYWRIRERFGRVYFEFSGDRSTWTTAGNLPHSYGDKMTSLRVRLECGFYGNEVDLDPFQIGGVNIT